MKCRLRKLKKKIKIVKENEKLSQNILIAVKEIAEDKKQSESQEDIYPEEDIYNNFSPKKDQLLFPEWHTANWQDKLRLIPKFEDTRLHWFAQKMIYQEAPEVLPEDLRKSIKRKIAKRILSKANEKWITIGQLYSEIDMLRDKYDDENDKEKLKQLDEHDQFAKTVEQKYENA